MIFRVNGYNEPTPTYFVPDQVTVDSLNSNPYMAGVFKVGTRTDAEAFLAQKQVAILASEASRFHVCATFIVGNDTTWREIQESDPEDTICQVLDHSNGLYTQCATKTEGFALNEQKKQEFLRAIGLDSVIELEVIEPMSAVIAKDNGQIPVEKL